MRKKKVKEQVYGTIVERDETKNQFEVLADSLPVFSDVNNEASQIGIILKGIYNLQEFINDLGYRWYKLDEHAWTRDNKGEIVVYLRKKSFLEFIKGLFKKEA